MAIYHFSVAVHSRSDGRSGVNSAAYRHGTRLKNTMTNEWSQSYKSKEILGRGLVVPPGEKMMGLAQMWNLSEAAEKRVNSVVAREIDMALPIELPLAAHVKMTREMAVWLSEKHKIGVDFAVHGDDPKNPHAHLGLTTRRLVGGKFTEKARELDECMTTKAGIGNGQIQMELMRKKWASITNAYLAEYEIEASVDWRSYERQGITKTPGKHMGAQTPAHHQHLAEKAVEAAARVVAKAERAARVHRIAGMRKGREKVAVAERVAAVTKGMAR